MNYFSFYKEGKALYCLIFTGILLSFSSSSAKNSKRTFNTLFQQHQVQGTVTDGTAPLPGVTIAVKNKSNNAVVSDYSGQYKITASATDTLLVSFIGFKTALIPISGRQTINIKLLFDSTTLQEVKVNAGYYSVKESERTGNIAKITSKDIEIQPVANVLAVMQGRMAGVNITQTTGVAGGGFDIKIRGQNSLRSAANATLYIIDGVPYSSNPIGSGQTSSIFPISTSPLNSINPDNIESIEVLKDADATSIYGSLGANGVVLITTKKGKSGKTRFTITSSTGAGTVTRFLKLMNTDQYLAMRKQAFLNDGKQYGKLVVYRFPKDKLVFGPKQVIGRINQDAEVSRQISLWDQRGSTVIQGSLLAIPIEESLLYVRPLYLKADTGKIPELKRVIVSYENKIAMEETLEAGLAKLFGSSIDQQVKSEDETITSISQSDSSMENLLKQAIEAYNTAVRAQKEGDWARYGEEIKKLGEILNKLHP